MQNIKIGDVIIANDATTNKKIAELCVDRITDKKIFANGISINKGHKLFKINVLTTSGWVSTYCTGKLK